MDNEFLVIHTYRTEIGGKIWVEKRQGCSLEASWEYTNYCLRKSREQWSPIQIWRLVQNTQSRPPGDLEHFWQATLP